MKNSLLNINRLNPNDTFNSQPAESFKKGDFLILFGELFQMGYANGLVDAAKSKGLKIIYSTVGRRDEHQNLRPLTVEECNSKDSPLINLPLECGFDLEPCFSEGPTPVDLCKSIGLKEGIQGKVDLDLITKAQEKGAIRFRGQVRSWVNEVEKQIKPGSKVLVAHLMAGGVPRSKIILSLMNRVFKGTGDRFLDSESFWNSPLGQFCQKSFFEVTANSFNILIEETTDLRNRLSSEGGLLHYVAYGYHGTPIYFKRQLQWLCYTPYLQGFAKKQLEEFSCTHSKKGVKTTVYNCPEILTQSSGIFPGVEIFLYLLYFELKQRNLKSPYLIQTLNHAEALIKQDGSDKIHELISNFLLSEEVQKTLEINTWPQHTNKSLMELMLKTSDEIISLHNDPNKLITLPLSELIIKASGPLILGNSFNPQSPVCWIGHDSVIDYYEKTSS